MLTNFSVVFRSNRPLLLTSFSVSSYHLPRHLIELSIIDGISCPLIFNLNLCVIFHFLTTKQLDLDCMPFIQAHVTISFMASNTHLECTCVVVVMVKSSI